MKKHTHTKYTHRHTLTIHTHMWAGQAMSELQRVMRQLKKGLEKLLLDAWRIFRRLSERGMGWEAGVDCYGIWV